MQVVDAQLLLPVATFLASSWRYREQMSVLGGQWFVKSGKLLLQFLVKDEHLPPLLYHECLCSAVHKLAKWMIIVKVFHNYVSCMWVEVDALPQMCWKCEKQEKSE